MAMKVGHAELIFFLVFCENCILMTWSASDGGDQNRPQEEKSKSSWGNFLKLGTSEREKDKEKEDTRGKGIAVGSSLAEEGTPIKGSSTELTEWTNDEIEDLLRYKYAYMMLGFYKGLRYQRDWKKISAAWSMKHRDIEIKGLNDYAAHLTRKMNEVSKKFDVLHHKERNIDWTGQMNEILISTYYFTEEGEASKHGERMYAEWVRKKYPGYQNVTPVYLFNRAKVMLHGVMKLTPANLNSEQPIVLKNRKHLILKKDHEDFLKELWKSYKSNMCCRRQKFYDDAVAKFGELRAIEKERLCEHVKHLCHKERGAGETRGTGNEKIAFGRSKGSIKRDHFKWMTEHDEALLRFWEEVKEEGPAYNRLERFHEIAVQRFSDLANRTPSQLYERVKYLRSRVSKRQQTGTADKERVQETHVPYHHFLDKQSMPSTAPTSQGTYHQHEWITKRRSNPEPSYQEPNLNLTLTTLHSEKQIPYTNRDLD